MKKQILFCIAAILLIGHLSAQINQEKLIAYHNTINQRSAKIVATLGIADSSKFYQVRDIIAKQYSDLNDVYAIRDSSRKEVKVQFAADKNILNQKLELIEKSTTAKTDSLHVLYLKKLNSLLSAQQIEKVKDGMTFGVLPLTYKAYQDMILTLSDIQKKQILDWLTEAREHAMDAESSEKKHAWFGKYKGRINNYLSAAGFDMKKEGEQWQERIKSQKKPS